ncbi:phosphatase PAP2 family protein [Bifidobacterium platyrrhinorum]|uniref:Phosphatase PAP2 family protein n=1 Tax=Bifidobacterium platyrrhinorum TaxID=2661628 RepID=A0A6L9STE6_9BIFI|nr:phosphatase PAP2 family protein [Bifidobacterium platyrrhinorum]NEG55359.1 phosphatase PAP2 family protein [Bifidobacterium platyrrhinorum]
MTDEQQPTNPQIRDPHAPVNLLRDFEPLDIPTVKETPVTLSDIADYDGDPTDGAHGDDAAKTSGVGRHGMLVEDDPLARRPRVSSRVLCLVLGLLLLAAAAGVYWFGVHTETGQSFDDMVEYSFNGLVPGWLAAMLGLGTHLVVLIGSALLAVVAAVVAVARKRWWLLGQLVVFGVLCFAASLLKDVLPRPFIIHTKITAGNSAPSGHTILAVAAAVALLCAVSRGWRWVAALVGVCWSAFVGMSVVHGQWHRPSDVVMAVTLVGGIALIVLAFTRASGMDATGKRRSSAGVQIVGSIAVTGGALACLYAAYVVWQVAPGLLMSAQWARSGSVAASVIMIVGVVALTFGLALVTRQLTAAPLTKLGLVGAPPAPPKRR